MKILTFAIALFFTMPIPSLAINVVILMVGSYFLGIPFLLGCMCRILFQGTKLLKRNK